MRMRASLIGRNRLKRALGDAGAETEAAAGDVLREEGARIAQSARQRVRALRDPERPARSHLAASIGVEEEDRAVQVKAEAAYAAFVEFGTRHMPAQPFLAPAMAEHRAQVRERLARAVEEILTQTAV